MSQAPAKKMILPSNLRDVHNAERQVLGEVEEAGYCEDACFAIRLALDEALCNAVKHGNAGDPDRTVELEYSIDEDQVRLSVKDEGVGFNPNELEDPTVGKNLERPSGRGVMLMRAYMSEVEFNEKGNQVRMVKYRNCKLPQGPK